MTTYPLNGEYYTEADDLEMIGHPDDWPSGFLFVKRGSPATEFGVVTTATPDEWGSSLVPWSPDARRIHGAASSRGSEWRYKSAAAMVADGWRVD